MWEEIFSLMFFISQRSIQLNVMAILLKANYFTYYRALQHKWRLDTLCLLLLISRKSRYSHLLLSAELWPEEFHAIVFCCPIGFINSVTLLIPLGNGSASHTLYCTYITFNIMLKDIYYENSLFCWNKTVLHYVAEWDIILLAGNEGALIPTQGCSSFHIVIAGEHLWPLMQNRKHLCSTVLSLGNAWPGEQIHTWQKKSLKGHDKTNIFCNSLYTSINRPSSALLE